MNRGAPSYNSGAIVGQMNVFKADFTMINENDYINCSLNFRFSNDSLFIRANAQADDCGYHSKGDFKKTRNEIPEYFIERSGEKTGLKI